MEAGRRNSLEPSLGLWDAVSLIVGIIIGVGIFETPASIFRMAPGPWSVIGVWVLGGVVALLGAFCFAELASTYPRSGGEYVYITRSFGSLAGYLFAWAQLTVVRPASIAGVAFVFGRYTSQLLSLPENNEAIFAILAVVTLTCVNVLGVTLGTRTQNFLTSLKVLGIGAIIFIGLTWGESRFHEEVKDNPKEPYWLISAMILVLWSFAGWHEAGYVAAEVKNARRNLPLALFLGTGAVTIIYVSINLAYWLGLGFEGARQASGISLATKILDLAWGKYTANAMAVLILISALGAINGMIFTTSRINSSFGDDHRLFRTLSDWSPTLKTPVHALGIQAAITLGMVAATAVTGRKGLDVMVEVSAAVFWLFFLLSGLALFVLRIKDSDLVRPYRVPAYPVTPILFCVCCVFMMVGSVVAKPIESVCGLAILAAGLPFYFLSHNKSEKSTPEIDERTAASV